MAMTGHDPTMSIAENYRAFARLQAHGRSPRYEALAAAVADDHAIVAFLEGLPRRQQQPNLLFGVARYLLDDVPDIESLRLLVTERQADLLRELESRRTQTNEPARCAALLPALATLPQPLALIEVGASAGLTLMVDHYSYDYDGHHVSGKDRLAPTFTCEARGPAPFPSEVPAIAWRAGLDLNPLDVTNPDDVRWLRCLVWPGEGDRESQLLAAVETARRDPPPIHRGDLLRDLPALAKAAPSDATLVVFHSAVLAYVGAETRHAFAQMVRGLGAVWLANEAVGVLSGITAPPLEGAPFLLVRDGEHPLAITDPHGTWLEWLS